MKVLIIAKLVSDALLPLAVYGEKSAGEANRVAGLVSGQVIGPFQLNRHVPEDATGLFHVELTKDGAVRGVSRLSVLDVLKHDASGLPQNPGWSIQQSRSRWRLHVRMWGDDKDAAIQAAKAVFAMVATGRQKSGTL
jgi:hypothetical protein